MNKQFETRDGEGALFKNEDRESEQHPHYRGNIKINGQEYWLSSWIKESKAGKKYMTLSAQPKQARDHRGASANPPARDAAPPARDELDDDIPF
jgi:hypothetical protein